MQLETGGQERRFVIAQMFCRAKFRIGSAIILLVLLSVSRLASAFIIFAPLGNIHCGPSIQSMATCCGSRMLSIRNMKRPQKRITMGEDVSSQTGLQSSALWGGISKKTVHTATVAWVSRKRLLSGTTDNYGGVCLAANLFSTKSVIRVFMSA